MNIEFRQLVRQYFEYGVEKRLPPELQYRIRYDPKPTAGMGPHTPSAQNEWIWSDWITIHTEYEHV